MRSTEFVTENYDAEEDDYHNRDKDDVRRARLTLKHINRLRKQRAIRKVEDSTRAVRVRNIYAASPE